MFSPVVVIGLPRSGSTLTTAVLNESTTHYVLNDAYFLQVIDANNSWDGFALPDHAEALKAQLVDVIVRRSAVHSPKTITNSSRMSEHALNKLLDTLSNEQMVDNSWENMMSSVLGQAAKAAGKTAWGWNTPQDLYHIDRVLKRFPKARFIFVMRSPFDVLSSFHHRPNELARRRYHPIAQAKAWNKAFEVFEKKKIQLPDQIMLVRYEDIVEDTPNQIARINNFIGSDIPEGLMLNELGSNSSYRAKSNNKQQAGKNISKTEQWLAEAIVGKTRVRYGYNEPPKKFSFDGAVYLLLQTGSFLSYYASAALLDKNVRKRIVRFLRK